MACERDGISDQLTGQGFVVVPNVIDSGQCDALAEKVSDAARIGVGTRKLLEAPWCQATALIVAEARYASATNSEKIRQLLPTAGECEPFANASDFYAGAHIDQPALVTTSIERGSVAVRQFVSD